ncbi:hypothetical protein KDW65_25165 [Burkholderia cenocepacia]|uniref:hypothetical protein n=1 Tax=Burkholderia cenocepacia TaxID=95486 RepID=UPI001B9C28AC|nr:hypothetical protein [Burkholderia cenocepacia]MBR8399926.1 hypothetical protein [Burkholderia cenocepacia]
MKKFVAAAIASLFATVVFAENSLNPQGINAAQPPASSGQLGTSDSKTRSTTHRLVKAEPHERTVSRHKINHSRRVPQ